MSAILCEVYIVLPVDGGQFGNVALGMKKASASLFCPVGTKGVSAVSVHGQGLRMRGWGCLSTAGERQRCMMFGRRDTSRLFGSRGREVSFKVVIRKPLIRVCGKQALATVLPLKKVHIP